jgi:hypothetical protein
MSHPPAFKLDALAAGDADATTFAHVAACEACASYVKALEGEAAEFRATADVPGFAERVAQRAKPAKARSAARLVWYAAPTLAAAAAFALWVGRGGPDVPHSASSGFVAIATDEGRVHFKGGPAVTVIRERGGVQERLSGPFEVLPSDRIRVQVAVDHDEPLTAGLLTSDGTWTPLLAPAELTAGSHLSELSARFDDSPTDAMLLVGSPDDVALARTTRTFDSIVAWHVKSSGSR